MSLLSTDVVVLHGFDYLETSRIFRLATRDAGIVSVIARGARTSKKRYGTALDLFASGVAHLNIRAGRDLHALAGFDLTDARHALAVDLEKFSAASAIAELALRFASAEEGGAFLDVLSAALDSVGNAPSHLATDAGLAGAWRLVAALGFAPSLEHCASCHERVPDDHDEVTFSRDAGGVLCARCAASLSKGRRLPAEARHVLVGWTSLEPTEEPPNGSKGFAAAPIARLPNEATRRAHLRLLREFLERHLSDGRELRAFESWERAGSLVAGVRPS